MEVIAAVSDTHINSFYSCILEVRIHLVNYPPRNLDSIGGKATDFGKEKISSIPTAHITELAVSKGFLFKI